MESIKDLLQQIKQGAEDKADEISTPQSTLFDTKKLATNPNKLFDNKHKYISTEYQMYGLRLAGKLNDSKRATMYIKWAKEKPRAILEMAYSFCIDYPSARDKSKIFMWKVKELEDERKKKSEE